MNVRDAGEALYIASEMERRAIKMYERALLVFGEGPCREPLQAILTEEKSHLARFLSLGAKEPGFEQAQLLSAQASGLLFSGGLMEAQRKGAFQSVKALYSYAAAEEAVAIERYGAFAAQLDGSAAEAFAAIAEEEKQHYCHFTTAAAFEEK
ncbi:MAG: hypothetical protein E7329_07610 [Clostridiales bacterium]|nr:hypothetical protein [Clostridiales bacterium]